MKIFKSWIVILFTYSVWKIELRFWNLRHCLMLIVELPIRKKRVGKKGEVFLTLVKTIQCWHASLTVCIQTKVLSDEVENQLGTNFPQHKFNTHSTSWYLCIQTTKKVFHICHISNHFDTLISDSPILKNISILDSLVSENKFKINIY